MSSFSNWRIFGSRDEGTVLAGRTRYAAVRVITRSASGHARAEPCTLYGTDHIIAALHDRSGDGANPTDIDQQLIVTFEKTPVDK